MASRAVAVVRRDQVRSVALVHTLGFPDAEVGSFVGITVRLLSVGMAGGAALVAGGDGVGDGRVRRRVAVGARERAVDRQQVGAGL